MKKVLDFVIKTSYTILVIMRKREKIWLTFHKKRKKNLLLLSRQS